MNASFKIRHRDDGIDSILDRVLASRISGVISDTACDTYAAPVTQVPAWKVYSGKVYDESLKHSDSFLKTIFGNAERSSVSIPFCGPFGIRTWSP